MKHEPATMQVFMTHRAMLTSYAAKVVGDRGLAEDIVQEAWLALTQMKQHKMLLIASGNFVTTAVCKERRPRRGPIARLSIDANLLEFLIRHVAAAFDNAGDKCAIEFDSRGEKRVLVAPIFTEDQYVLHAHAGVDLDAATAIPPHQRSRELLEAGEQFLQPSFTRIQFVALDDHHR